MTDTYDALVIGGGFKGMMTAYGLTKQGGKVCIVEQGKQLGGFMSPMNWRGVAVDKGPQYLDGISEANKLILDDIMQGFEPLASLNYSYGSFWNDTYTDGFALPDYRSLPVTDRATVLYESLNSARHLNGAATIAEQYSDEDRLTYTFINGWCHKFLRQDATRLSPINRNFVTFFGRKLLLDNALSVELKKHPLLDDTLAASKTSIDHGTHNLYPVGRNLGYFREAFESRLDDMGVDALTETTVQAVERNGDAYTVSTSGGAVKAGAVYCAATIESTEELMLGSRRIAEHIVPVPQIFYLLELDSHVSMPFYIMNYSTGSVSRVTNFSAYGNRGEENRTILCVEVPTDTDNPAWENPDSHYPVVLEEIAAMGIDTGAITTQQAFRVPSTYRSLLEGYEGALAEVTGAIRERHGEGIHVITPHLLTRASIMADLGAHGILS